MGGIHIFKNNGARIVWDGGVSRAFLRKCLGGIHIFRNNGARIVWDGERGGHQGERDMIKASLVSDMIVVCPILKFSAS